MNSVIDDFYKLIEILTMAISQISTNNNRTNIQFIQKLLKEFLKKKLLMNRAVPSYHIHYIIIKYNQINSL